MIRLIFFSFLFGFSVLLSSCQSADRPSSDVYVKVYEGGYGRVMDIVADGNMAVVRHDDIPGFMLGMTMTFGLREDSIRQALTAGDSISFDVSFDGIDSWISRVDVIE